MNVKKTIKKIGALLTGATMVGATILGATADLSEYPAPFVANGIVDAMLVIGANAKTSDTLGAVDIAASLQAAATVPAGSDSSVVTTIFSGDYVEIAKNNDRLELEENIGDVREVLTADDLDMLSGGSVTTDKGTTAYSQYLRFNIGNTPAEQAGEVVFAENDDDVVGDYLQFNRTLFTFEYELQFDEGLESDISGTELEDIEDKTIEFFGIQYSVVDTYLLNNNLILELLGGDVTDTMADGESKTYTIDGIDYEVTVVFISSGTEEAMFSVNGVFTDTLGEGSTDILENGIEIGVREIMTNDREGIVSFFLGANKLELRDNDVTDGAFHTGTAVKVADESISDGQLKIVATNTSTEFELTDIKYRLYTDGIDGNGDVYIPPLHGLKEFLEQQEGMINPMWDIRYEGMEIAPTYEVNFDAGGGDSEYTLEFTSNEGIEYRMPLVSNKNAGFNLGDDDDDLFFLEPAGLTNVSFFSNHVGDDDYFVLTDDNDDSGFTHILQWTKINTDENQLTFEDIGSGEGSRVITYSGTGADDGENITGYYSAELNVGGNTYNIYLYNVSGSWYIIPDHDGDGSINAGEKADIITKGGLIIDLGINNTPSDSWNVSLTTLGSEYDENIANQTVYVNITSRSPDEVGLSVGDGLTLWDLEDNDELQQGLDLYGTFYELNDPSDSNKAEELTIDYPTTQRGTQVFVTAGSYTKSTSGGTGGAVVVNPAAVGIAVLDTAVTLGQGNLIVIGGPCVNNIAGDLLGNPAQCTEGFEPGKAIIELFDSQNALLVAGHSPQDTLGAAYVLSDYMDYDLSGTKVEVVVADLDTLSVTRVE